MTEYTRNTEERTPFMGRNKSDFDNHDEEEQAISGAGTTSSYPPAPAYSGKAILTYTYTSSWNQTSSKMGLFGQSKEETIDIIQNTFTELAEYPHDRFRIFVQLDGSTTPWVEIMDGVWPEIIARQPQHLHVKIRDLPGEEMKRMRFAALCILGFFGSIIGLILLLTYLFPGKSNHKSVKED